MPKKNQRLSLSTKKNLDWHLRNILEIIQEKYPQIDNIGVIAGRMGAALLNFQASSYFEDLTYSHRGVEIITSCITKINEGYQYPTHCAGIAGFGAGLYYLSNQKFIELNTNSFLTPFDGFLVEQMNICIFKNNFDFLHGALGYGNYFYHRMVNSNNIEEKKKYLKLLIELVNGLEKQAITHKATKFWITTLIKESNTKGINLSLSHGISSIIYFLQKIYGFDKNLDNKILPLLHGAINYLTSKESCYKGSISLYPSWVIPDTKTNYHSRVAWCYGDIGIGIALNLASITLNDMVLKKRAMNILKHSSRRKYSQDTMVVDPGFCHGSFGNSHIFYQLYLKEHEKTFLDAAQFWLEDGINRYTGNPQSPFVQIDPRTFEKKMSLDLLEGLPGIGLVLLKHLTGKNDIWDECLLLN